MRSPRRVEDDVLGDPTPWLFQYESAATSTRFPPDSNGISALQLLFGGLVRTSPTRPARRAGPELRRRRPAVRRGLRPAELERLRRRPERRRRVPFAVPAGTAFTDARRAATRARTSSTCPSVRRADRRHERPRSDRAGARAERRCAGRRRARAGGCESDYAGRRERRPPRRLLRLPLSLVLERRDEARVRATSSSAGISRSSGAATCCGRTAKPARRHAISRSSAPTRRAGCASPKTNRARPSRCGRATRDRRRTACRPTSSRKPPRRSATKPVAGCASACSAPTSRRVATSPIARRCARCGAKRSCRTTRSRAATIPSTRAACSPITQEAQALGATGVPAVRLADQDFVLVGAQPEAVYLRWLRRAIEARVA